MADSVGRGEAVIAAAVAVAADDAVDAVVDDADAVDVVDDADDANADDAVDAVDDDDDGDLTDASVVTVTGAPVVRSAPGPVRYIRARMARSVMRSSAAKATLVSLSLFPFC